jgi:zinc transport system substrate-binding protein
MKKLNLAVIYSFVLLGSYFVPNVSAEEKLRVMTTLFPLYDFAKNVCGDRMDVSLILPPGVEPHEFEPKAGDIIKMGNSDIFIYTGSFMEPWAGKMLKGLGSAKLLVIDASRDVTPLKIAEKHGSDQADQAVDPHIWLDFSNDKIIINNILAGFIEKDPGNKDLYQKNAQEYMAKLDALDKEYRDALSACKKNVIIQGGHNMFGYLAKRYNIKYITALGLSPNSEPGPRDLIELSKKVRQYGIKYIYFEELVNPRVAATIADETGAKLLELNGAHNLTRDQFKNGTSFISLMEQNLRNLKIGLECQ